MSADPAPEPALKALLKTSFPKLWLAQFVSVFGDFLALFGVISLITFRWHGSAVQVTWVMLAFMLPMVVVAPPAGVFVDRLNVKGLMIASDLIRAGLVFALPFVTSVFQICLIFAALSVVSSFFTPAQSVALRQLVPAEKLMAANAMMSQAFYVVRILSPAVAGLMVAKLSEKACFYADTVSFVFSAAMLATIALSLQRQENRQRSVRALTSDFLAGNKFIFTHSGLTFVFTAMAMTMLVLSAFGPLISIYVRDFLSAGPVAYGNISAMVGVGLILGTVVLTGVAAGVSRTSIVFIGLLGTGVGAAVLGMSGNIVMAGLSTFTLGFAVAFVVVPAQTMSQQETPPDMVGRVSSSFMSMVSLSQALGILASGYLADRMGLRPLFFLCAIVLALLAAAGYLIVQNRPVEPVAG